MSGTHPDGLFTLEVGGVPTLVFGALNHTEAMSLRKEVWFLDDLTKARSSGKSLWDGKAPLKIRRSTASETAAYERAANSVVDGSEDDLFIAYLVELDR